MLSPNIRTLMRLPLRIALSHHDGPRRLISFCNSAPGMMP